MERRLTTILAGYFVITGMQRGSEVEILSGLKEADEIVVSGQFLIDSESSLRASFLRMSNAGNGTNEIASSEQAKHDH